MKELIQRGEIGNCVVTVEEHFRNRWGDYINMYTDGSRDPKSRRVGFGLYVPHVQICQSRSLMEYQYSLQN